MEEVVAIHAARIKNKVGAEAINATLIGRINLNPAILRGIRAIGRGCFLSSKIATKPYVKT
jgi:hypothetical protein